MKELKTPAEALVAIMMEVAEPLEHTIRSRRLEAFPVVHGSVEESAEVRAFIAAQNADSPWTRMEWDGLIEDFNAAVRISDLTGDLEDPELKAVHDRLETATDVACRFIGDLIHGAEDDDEERMSDRDCYPYLLFPA